MPYDTECSTAHTLAAAAGEGSGEATGVTDAAVSTGGGAPGEEEIAAGATRGAENVAAAGGASGADDISSSFLSRASSALALAL